MSRALQLGELLSLGATSSAHLSAWLRAEDEPLAECVEREAAVRGESMAQFIRIAVADFMEEADEEAWTELVSRLSSANDPGAACVAHVTRFRLALEQPDGGRSCAQPHLE